MTGVVPHIIVMGMPQFIIMSIVPQHILSMSMFIMPVGSIAHVMPLAVISQVIDGVIGMPQHIIMGMPQQVIMQDVPFFIIVVSIVHMSCIMAMVVPSAGVIVQTMPFSLIAQVM